MWNYKEVDSFFEEEDFNFLVSQCEKIDLEGLNHQEIAVHNNKIFKDGRVETSTIPKEKLLELHEKYTPKLIESLKYFAPKKLPFYDCVDFHLVVQGKDYLHHIHEDDYRKLLSVVVYLHPSRNFGTSLFTNKSGRGQQTIEWRKNKALIFSRREGETWHSFKSDGINRRYTLVYNLLVSDTARRMRRRIITAEGKFLSTYVYRGALALPRIVASKALNALGMREIVSKILKRLVNEGNRSKRQ